MSEAKTQTKCQHHTVRCTNEEGVTKAMDAAYESGYTLLSAVGGGDSHAMWLIFQRRTVVQVMPQPAPAAPADGDAPPVGGGFPL